MDREVFESELGDVFLTLSGISREISGSEVWDEITAVYSEKELTSSAGFSEIDGIDLDWESLAPGIELRLEGGWKKMFFIDEEVMERCFQRLRYRLSCYRQNQGKL